MNLQRVRVHVCAHASVYMRVRVCMCMCMCACACVHRALSGHILSILRILISKHLHLKLSGTRSHAPAVVPRRPSSMCREAPLLCGARPLVGSTAAGASRKCPMTVSAEEGRHVPPRLLGWNP